MILVLDFDGVVQTGHPDGGRWDRNLVRDMGMEPTALAEHFFVPHWRDIMTGRRDLLDVLGTCWPQLGSNTTPQAFIDYWFAQDFTLDDAVLAEVGAWRKAGRLCVIATNQEHYRARYLWRDRGISKHFDELFYSAALGVGKPEAEFFRRAQVKLGVDAGELIFLDDFAPNVEAARGEGWAAHHYRGIEDLRAALATSG
jgi:putative hydrolase of the HAD superfamily